MKTKRSAAMSAVFLAAVVGLAACGSSSSPKTATVGTPIGASSAPAAASGATAIDYVVAGGKLVSGPHMTTVKLGSTVTVSVATDAPDELHVHGYDKEAETAGNKASVTFTANLPGVFDIELHKTDLALGQLTVK